MSRGLGDVYKRQERINTMRKGLIKIQVSRVNIIAILRVKTFVTHHRVIKTHEEKTATARDTRVFVKGVVRNMLKSITTKHFKPIPTRFLTCDDLKRSSMVTNVRVRRAIEQKLRVLDSISQKNRTQTSFPKHTIGSTKMLAEPIFCQRFLHFNRA